MYTTEFWWQVLGFLIVVTPFVCYWFYAFATAEIIDRPSQVTEPNEFASNWKIHGIRQSLVLGSQQQL